MARETGSTLAVAQFVSRSSGLVKAYGHVGGDHNPVRSFVRLFVIMGWHHRGDGWTDGDQVLGGLLLFFTLAIILLVGLAYWSPSPSPQPCECKK